MSNLFCIEMQNKQSESINKHMNNIDHRFSNTLNTNYITATLSMQTELNCAMFHASFSHMPSFNIYI